MPADQVNHDGPQSGAGGGTTGKTGGGRAGQAGGDVPPPEGADTAETTAIPIGVPDVSGTTLAELKRRAQRPTDDDPEDATGSARDPSA